MDFMLLLNLIATALMILFIVLIAREAFRDVSENRRIRRENEIKKWI
jgi:hypothetical protein